MLKSTYVFYVYFYRRLPFHESTIHEIPHALRTELGQLSYSLKARKTPQQWRDQYAAIRGIRIF